MDASPLRPWVKATPFVPFTVITSYGQYVSITCPEMTILGRRMDVVAFVDQQDRDRHVIIRHEHVVTILAD